MTATTDETLAFWGKPEGPERETARRAAYATLFHGSELGRMVLRDLLEDAGVGKRMGPVAVNREYEAGRHDLALEIMDLADFSQADLVSNLTEPEEGYFHERNEL